MICDWLYWHCFMILKSFCIFLVFCCAMDVIFKEIYYNWILPKFNFWAHSIWWFTHSGTTTSSQLKLKLPPELIFHLNRRGAVENSHLQGFTKCVRALQFKQRVCKRAPSLSCAQIIHHHTQERIVSVCRVLCVMANKSLSCWYWSSLLSPYCGCNYIG